MSITHSFSCVIEKRFCNFKLPCYLLYDTKIYLWITYPLEMKQGSEGRSHQLHGNQNRIDLQSPETHLNGPLPSWPPSVCFLQRSAASLKRTSISVSSIISWVLLKKEVPSLKLRLPVLPIPLSLILRSEPWCHFQHFLLSSSC